MSDIHYGTKYKATEKLRRTEIAKLIRADIKTAISVGELPKGTYSVQCRSYAGGGSIDVRVGDLPFNPHNPERVIVDITDPHTFHPECHFALYTPEARVTLKRVQTIMDAYNFDGSESQTDYFHVRFYGHAEFDSEWSNNQREVVIAKHFPLMGVHMKLVRELQQVANDAHLEKTGKALPWCTPEVLLQRFPEVQRRAYALSSHPDFKRAVAEDGTVILSDRELQVAMGA